MYAVAEPLSMAANDQAQENHAMNAVAGPIIIRDHESATELITNKPETSFNLGKEIIFDKY